MSAGIAMMNEAIAGLDEAAVLADVGPLCLKLARVPLPIGMRERRPNPFVIDALERREARDREELMRIALRRLTP